MSDPGWALQKAIFQALNGQTEAGEHVFDSVPASNPFPRITFGPGQSVGNFADCYDGTESFLEVNVWSNKTASMPEVKRIASQVREILHDADETTLALEGHTLELMEFQDAVFSRDPDGKTSRARMTIRALTQPAESG